MKAQQILNSFLPGVTAAVLTTQPTWAETVTVDNSQVGRYPSIFATSVSSDEVESNTFTFSKDTDGRKYPAPVTPPGVKLGGVKPDSRKISGVKPTSKTGVIINALKKKDQNQDNQSLKTASHRSSTQALKKPSSRKVSYRKNDSSGIKKFEAVAIKKPDDKIFQKLQRIATGPGSAQLLKVGSCPQGQDPKLHNLLSASAASTCKKINSISHKKLELAQSIAPAPVQPTRPSLQGPTSIPNGLEPSANPLNYPTKPSEVTVGQNQPLTLQQALEFAKRNNQELQVSLLQLERAKAGLKVARAALLPNVGLNAQVVRQQSASGQLQGEAARDAGVPPDSPNFPDDSPSTAFTGGAQLNYNIFTSGARGARIRQAEEQVRLQELDVERLSEEIRLNVATEYYNLQEADEQVRISRAAVVNAEASLRDARALEQAGVGTRFDSLRTQVNLANSQQQLTNARSQQRIARRALATRLNLAQSATLSAADPVKLAGLWRQTLENSIVLAYQNRPELQQQLAQRNISQQQRREALSQLGPQVSLIANYELLDGFDDNVGLTDGYSIALQANLNLFDGGASRAQAAQAKADTEIAETQFSSTRNQIRFQVEQAYSSLRSNLENVQTSEAALNQARESLRLARLRFQAGVGTQLEVLDAENALTRAEGNRVTAILEYNRALASLQRAVTARGLP
ncbi:MAG: TolC family protein [Rivularia sp. (in: Bacteria)]|nr:TolC family protein [Rivularia sp. MS3]